MFGSHMLEVATGIVLIYALVSVLCTAIHESIEAFLKKRARYLEDGIRELLQDNTGEGLAKAFYEHPLIFCLSPGKYHPSRRPRWRSTGWGRPSYIPARSFSAALLDLVARGQVIHPERNGPGLPVASLGTIRNKVASLQNAGVQQALLAAIDSAHGDIDTARKNIEAWYDSTMDRVSGWYRRATQWTLLAIGGVLATGLNINTLTLPNELYHNDKQRQFIVSTVEKRMADGSLVTATYQEGKRDLENLKLPVGWPNGLFKDRNNNGVCNCLKNCAISITGWLLTAIAVSLGAPFWFDLLNKVMVIRSTVKPHEKSPEEASEDRSSAQTSARHGIR